MPNDTIAFIVLLSLAIVLTYILLPIFIPIIDKYNKEAIEFYKLLLERTKGKH